MRKIAGKKNIINRMNVIFHSSDAETLAEMAEAVAAIAQRHSEEEEKPHAYAI